MKWNGSSIAGAVLIFAAVVLAFLVAPDDETTAYRLGYALGLPIFALAITTLGRWVQRLATRGDDEEAPFWTPGAVLALGIVAALVALLSISSRAEEREQDAVEFQSMGEECLADQPLPLSTPASGFAYGPLTAEDSRLFATAARELGVSEDLFEGREVTRRGSFAGAVLILPGVGDGDYQDFLRGATDGAADQGLRPRPIRVGGEEGIVATSPQISQVAVRSGCYGVVVVALDPGTARVIATAVATNG